MSERHEQEIDKNKVRAVEDYIDNEYHLTDLIAEKSMGSLNGRTMSCPFHEDLSPSLFVDEKSNLWKCHSCGKGGRYVSLFQNWYNIIEGKKFNYYTAMEKILFNDDKAKVYLGFNSIFKEKHEKVDIEIIKQTILNKVVRERHKPTENVPITYEKLLYDLKKYDTDTILDALTAMQKGKSARAIQMMYKDGPQDVKEMSLEEMMLAHLD